MSETGFVVYREADGAFVGHMMGMSFWSKIDPVGQSEAVAFPSEEIAKLTMKKHDNLNEGDYQLIPVQITNKKGLAYYASIESCVKANIPAWHPDGFKKGVLVNPTRQLTKNFSKEDLLSVFAESIEWGNLLDYMEEVYVVGERQVAGCEVLVLYKDNLHYLTEKDTVKIIEE